MNEDYEPRNPQDALDGSDRDIDPISAEENEDLSERLHRDPHELKEDMDKYEDSDTEESEDYREELEDLDQET